MKREVAWFHGRWFTVLDFPVKLELTAVCEVQEEVREWFRQVPKAPAENRAIEGGAGNGQ